MVRRDHRAPRDSQDPGDNQAHKVIRVTLEIATPAFRDIKATRVTMVTRVQKEGTEPMAQESLGLPASMAPLAILAQWAHPVVWVE